MYTCTYSLCCFFSLIVLSKQPQPTCVPECDGGVSAEFGCIATDDNGGFLPQKWVIRTADSKVLKEIYSNNASTVPSEYDVEYNGPNSPVGLKILEVSKEMNGYSFTCIGFNNAGQENASSPALLEVAG